MTKLFEPMKRTRDNSSIKQMKREMEPRLRTSTPHKQLRTLGNWVFILVECKI